ncbi:S8 family serine peptidase [Paenibacillus sp. FSL H8-0168]|uniref:S8 family serine peptidase n=1 Tax=Paenibacillus sp. FSL H8-0168 TaxID=2921378 RepID=UPI0031582682
MIKSKNIKKTLSVSFTALLAFSLISPVYGDSSTTTSAGASTISAKVSAKLNQQFSASEYVTYLVKLKDQVDTESVAKHAFQKASAEQISPAATKLSVRTTVVNSLMDTAEKTQQSVEEYLKKEVNNGNVKKYKSYFIVNAFAVTSTKEVMDNLATLPEIDKILPDEKRELQKVEIDKDAQPVVEESTADQAVADQAAVDTAVTEENAQKSVEESVYKDAVTPSRVEWNISKIKAPQVWAKGIDGKGIVVANLDTGVEYTHPALKRKWRGLNASGQVVNPELSWYDAVDGASLPTDSNGHGTHTMGTSVGSDSNGTNEIGVAPGAKWIAVRVFNPDTTDSILLDGGQWILAPVDKNGKKHPELAPDVVNNSWGGGPGLDEWYRPVTKAWRAAQIFPEFSAGNTTLSNPGGPGSVANPANLPEAYATGATDINNKLASFSLRGPSPYGEVKPEISAPGVNIRSSVPGGVYEGGWNGTSMAGPHTAGLAALLLQAKPSLTVDQLEDVISKTATPLTDSQYRTSPNNGYGYGLIDALAAVNSVLK